MDDIRLFETDGDFLVLEAQDGQKFRLLVDDAVRSSIKRDKLPQLDSITITPREIQEEIRNGATIEELMQRSGADFDYVEKFAAPVIAELEHIVSSALSVRLTIAGDRYNDSTQVEFGEIINGRLITSGATAINWVAKKIEPNSWHVIANYSLNGAEGSATWTFDPRRLTLSPESETAVTLSSQETINNSIIPKLRTVEQSYASESNATVVMDDVIPIGRGSEFETPTAIEPEQDRPAPSTPAAFLKPVQAEPSEVSPPTSMTPPTTPQPLSATADLLEALRRKRTEREEPKTGNLDLENHPNTEKIRVIDIEPTPVIDDVDITTEDKSEVIEDGNVVNPPPQKKGRATMPSWDEIVFGTKADD